MSPHVVVTVASQTAPAATEGSGADPNDGLLLTGATVGPPQVSGSEPRQALAPPIATAATTSAWNALRPMHTTVRLAVTHLHHCEMAVDRPNPRGRLQGAGRRGLTPGGLDN